VRTDLRPLLGSVVERYAGAAWPVPLLEQVGLEQAKPDLVPGRETPAAPASLTLPDQSLYNLAGTALALLPAAFSARTAYAAPGVAVVSTNRVSLVTPTRRPDRQRIGLPSCSWR
jgi:hypothetical protein